VLAIVIVFIAVLAAVPSAAAQRPTPAPAHPTGTASTGTDSAIVDEGVLAWERGDYPAALRAFRGVLQRPNGEAQLERIALVTGELFESDSLAPDGRSVALSPRGDLATYETGAGARRMVHFVRLGGDVMRADSSAGFDVAFSPTGDRATFLRVPETDELRAERAAMARIPVADRTAIATQNRKIAEIEARVARVVLRDLSTGRETEYLDDTLLKSAPVLGGDGSTVYVLGRAPTGQAGLELYAFTAGGARPTPLTGDGLIKSGLAVIPRSGKLTYLVDQGDPFSAQAFATRRGPNAAIVIFDPATRESRRIPGWSPSSSADGSAIAYVTRQGAENAIGVVKTAGGDGVTVVHTTELVDAPSLSPDGRQVAYQRMPREDWELFAVNADGTDDRRLTRDIQDDLQPTWLSSSRILAKFGEGRHRRAYLLDPATGAKMRVLHNNTVRTIAPEYEWETSADGSKVLFVAERDGDTVSPERGVYLVDLSRKVTKAELVARIDRQLAAELSLRERGERTFAPIASSVRSVVADVSKDRIFRYENALFQFDSKHITQPGNKKAIDYLEQQYRSFGYQPELQWFEARGARPGSMVRTANVVATLKGTTNPELVYVVSSHFDSRAEGPGADDDASGTAALLEAARVLAKHPQPATIVFASFTGEEAGLLGSREFVRRAVMDSVHLVGALNNDMVGFANDQRLDNTIRYSNPGIRDIQHGAAIQFTRLITYDALYYKSTDAAAYYEAYGDIVGGIGSYPVLSNPHYHEPHDVLETINHDLVTETSKTTVATLMLLASSPSRLAGVAAGALSGGAVDVSWTAAPERGVVSYRVAYGPPSDPLRRSTSVREPRVHLTGIEPGWVVSVKAVNARGLEGWDWGRTIVR
jgi:peptidase M28-like protein/WD40 repeat protein